MTRSCHCLTITCIRGCSPRPRASAFSRSVTSPLARCFSQATRVRRPACPRSRSRQSKMRRFRRIYFDFCPLVDGAFVAPQDFNQITMAWYLNHSDVPNVVTDPEPSVYRVPADLRKAKSSKPIIRPTASTQRRSSRRGRQAGQQVPVSLMPQGLSLAKASSALIRFERRRLGDVQALWQRTSTVLAFSQFEKKPV